MKSIKIKDHQGNEFKSISKLCEFYEIPRKFFREKQQQGLTVEEILIAYSQRDTKVVKDHLGNSFNSLKDMCEYYGISSALFIKRQKQGFTLEECLTKSMKVYKTTDHLGNTFESITKMCECYGIERNTFRLRINRGWTLSESLMNYKDYFGYMVSYKDKSPDDFYMVVKLEDNKKYMAKLDWILRQYRRNNHLEELSIVDTYKHYYKDKERE